MASSDLRTVNYHGSVELILFLQLDIEDVPLEREKTVLPMYMFLLI